MEQLGIEPLQLATQVFNFIVMAVALGYFLYKPILKMINDRRDKIAEGLAYTEKAKAEYEKTDAKKAAMLSEAKDEAREIVEEAKKSGKQQEAEIISKAHEEARAIVEKGKADVSMERIDMEKSLRGQMIEAASAIASKAIESALTTSDHRDIIAKKIRVIAKQLS